MTTDSPAAAGKHALSSRLTHLLPPVFKRPRSSYVREPWWERWNRECGTKLTKADAERISRKAVPLKGKPCG
jgi:hypothetical protein